MNPMDCIYYSIIAIVLAAFVISACGWTNKRSESRHTRARRLRAAARAKLAR